MSNSEYMKSRRHRLKVLGLCTQCGKHPASSGALCPKCRESQTASRLVMRESRTDSGLCVVCGKTVLHQKKMCTKCLEKNRVLRANSSKYKEQQHRNRAEQRRRLKLEVLDAYGGPVCSCCGEQQILFLTIDHIGNNGAEHRKEVASRDFYKWLKDGGFPPGFQVLCWNCNHGKQMNGGVCPHVGAVNVLVRAHPNSHESMVRECFAKRVDF